jgi:MFS family permease
LNINFSGFLADIFVRRKILTTTNTRKLFNIPGNLLPAIFLVALAFMTCQLKYVAVILLTIGVTTRYAVPFFLVRFFKIDRYFASGFCFGGGFMLVANDMAPAYAGIVFGISNTFATIPGIVSPYVVGALTEKVSLF